MTHSISSTIPLAARLRPTKLEEYIGQAHLLAPGKPLYMAIKEGRLHSMIFWGPPGTGKTTLAKLIAEYAQARVETLSAVLAGVKEIRAVVERAQATRAEQATVLFVDEVHRFNKSQQDVLLPHVEEGTFTLIGATTENPSFELNNALLSRTRVYVLKRLSLTETIQIIDQALQDKTRGLGELNIEIAQADKEKLAMVADGDARQALNLLEIAADLAVKSGDKFTITEAVLAEVLTNGVRRFDKGGEMFYDQISALHKSIRGSSPDAALYWFASMIEGGCDPLYIARRVVRAASEDIGNADPRALQLALNAYEVQERLGSPEGELTIAQAIIYLACAPKSNASYVAWSQVKQDIKNQGSTEVPLHLRNAPTRLMKELNYGKAYRYAHDEPDAYVAGEHYFPEGTKQKQYYHPVLRGLEIKIAEKLAKLRELDRG